MTPPSAAVRSAWQAALAAEHQAVFGYTLLGPRLTGADRHRAGRDVAAHEQVRDDTEVALAATGVTPVGPRADYPALFPVATAGAARRLAVRLEDDTADAWRSLYAAAARDGDATARTAAQRYLTAAAVRAVRWRARVDPAHPTTPFPGI